jgi:hypothetical protein
METQIQKLLFLREIEDSVERTRDMIQWRDAVVTTPENCLRNSIGLNTGCIGEAWRWSSINKTTFIVLI